MSFKRV